MINFLTSLFSRKTKVLILGFGKEGKSTYRFIRKHLPEMQLAIADFNTDTVNDELLLNDNNVEVITGKSYLDSLDHFHIIIKSPGVKINNISKELSDKITSQTDLFMQCYANHVIGVTGTKGKSTTSSLIKHFLDSDNKNAMLLGNIGVPSFDMIDQIKEDSIVVYELSAHQLEFIKKSPHIAVLLNVFPEHLDYFDSFEDYRRAKFNICEFQNNGDCLIIHKSLTNELNLQTMESLNDNRQPIIETGKIIEIPGGDIISGIDNSPLAGAHNLINIEAALFAAGEAGVNIDVALNSLDKFRSLPHRLEYIGEFAGIRFVNDSISTVPESTIAAVKALESVDTLILGGFDRGLDYVQLADFLLDSNINNFVFLGKAGDRIYDIMNSLSDKYLFKSESIEKAFDTIMEKTEKGKTCLLSPAAASYDQFHNFEHRGDTFKELAAKL